MPALQKIPAIPATGTLPGQGELSLDLVNPFGVLIYIMNNADYPEPDRANFINTLLETLPRTYNAYLVSCTSLFGYQDIDISFHLKKAG